jgi:Pectate lyase superfamily protein
MSKIRVDSIATRADTDEISVDDIQSSAELASGAGSSTIGYTPAGTGAVATTVQTKLRESVSVKDFGAVGDGVADDTAAIQDALDSAGSSGVELYFPSGTYATDTALSLTNGDDYWLSGTNAKILTTASSLFTNFGASMHLRGMIFEGPTYGINYLNATAQCDIVFEAEYCQWLNFGSVAFRSYTTQTYTNSFTRFTLSNCLFDGNRNDILLTQYDLTDVIVEGNRFLNGGPESCNFIGGTNQGARYIFDGNIFYNYLNDLGPVDADGHFIRCYGERAVISNNIFDTINVAVGTAGGDTEALRPACDKLIVSNNLFRNAGMAEGVAALKGCEESLVIGNHFYCTDDYNTQAIARGFYTLAVLANPNCKIIGNTFENFNGAIVDTQDGTPNLGTILIENNLLIDCQCNQYSSSQLFRLSAENTRYVIRGNVVKTSEATNKYPVNIFRTGNAKDYVIENNYFYCTGYIFENIGTSNVTCSGNTYQECSRIIANGAFSRFFSLNDTFIHSTGPTFSTVWGVAGVETKNFLVEGMTLNFGNPANYRFITVAPAFDCVGSFEFDFQFLDGGGLASAVHTGSGFLRASGGTRTIDSLAQDTFYTIGAPTLTKASPAIVSNAVAFMRPNSAVSGTSVQGTISVKFKGY